MRTMIKVSAMLVIGVTTENERYAGSESDCGDEPDSLQSDNLAARCQMILQALRVAPVLLAFFSVTLSAGTGHFLTVWKFAAGHVHGDAIKIPVPTV